MPTLNLKPTHSAVQTYYQNWQEVTAAGQSHEGAVAPAFADLLKYCAKQVNWRFIEQESLRRGSHFIRPDGVFLDEFNLRHGVWEAKDSQDSLEKEIQAKFQQGYPKDNIIFQSPERLVIYQGGDKPVFDAHINESPARLVEGLKLFFEYQKPEIADWHQVTEEFQGKMAVLGQQLVGVIQREYKTNRPFQEAFDKFMKLCQTAINPNLRRAAIEEMLVQHLLTERIFTTVFDNPDFVEKNVIAREINQVVTALTSPSFNKAEFVKQNQLARFYTALEKVAATIEDYTDKQPFLNAVYERFFQGFAVKVADTHGIVYTPQPIVEFMVKSVQEILQQEFGRSLADQEVHIIDPFVGTGNFMIRLLKEIYTQNPLQLTHKYLQELHGNEIMLLPYYIASMNIEHEFYELAGKYLPYEGICLVDTFELVEGKQTDMFVSENTQRVRQQTGTPIFVIIGNPPYNVGQQDENDNNKNRKYLGNQKVAGNGNHSVSPGLDDLIAESYAKDSKATLKMQLYDPYVRAFQWATWRLRNQEEGIVALVSNNSFLEGLAFDGMRRHLAQDFAKVYCFDLGGNIRKTPGVQNVFGIKVGVSINLLVKHPGSATGIFYAHIGDHLKKQEKLDYLANHSFTTIDWQKMAPDENHTWLTSGLRAEFEGFMPLGMKEGKAANGEVDEVVFKVYSNGVKTNRDVWAYNFSSQALAANMQRTIETYNEQVFKWSRLGDRQVRTVDDFVLSDQAKISWSSTLKRHLDRLQFAELTVTNIRTSLYRPFTRQFLYFEGICNDRRGQFPKIFPTTAAETENRVICVSAVGSATTFQCLLVNVIPDLHLTGDSQCFPFYTYAEDGTHRQENLSDWALNHYRQHYQDKTITKWDIFYYVYGLLHHPSYRDQYAANLKRELPRIPLLQFPQKRRKEKVPPLPGGKRGAFGVVSDAGKQLAELHLNYEQQPAYPLRKIATPGVKPHYRVDKMRLTKEKDALIYNDALTLTGIPPEVLEYRLGNRSALEWVLDQYQVTVDGQSGSREKLEWLNDHQAKTAKGSGILNDPNRQDDEQYILRLISQVMTVSLETLKIVKELVESVQFT